MNDATVSDAGRRIDNNKQEMEVNVKCPKCRYRYDTQVAPGIKEVACVCPRCGTPFTFVVPEDEPGPDAIESVQDQQWTASEPPVDRPEPPFAAPIPSSGGVQEDITAYNAQQRGQRPPVIPGRPTPPPPPFKMSGQPAKPRSGCVGSRLLKGCFIVAVAVMLLLIVIVKGCSSDESFNGSTLDDNTEVVESAQIPQVSAAERAKAEREEQAGKAPSWIQGNWIYHTDYGVISVKIHGRHIAETAGGDTSYGTFTFENGHLNCDFGDGSIIVYKLDDERQQIDCGDGMLMQKVD